jgi:hypothetical protein
MQIAITLQPTSLHPEIFGGGVWGAGRFWPLGTTTVEVVDNEWYEPEYFAMIANEAQTGLVNLWTPRKLQPQSPAVLAALAGETGGISPVDIAPSTAAPGTYEDTAFRTTIGQRAFAVLLACPLLVVTTLS